MQLKTNKLYLKRCLSYFEKDFNIFVNALNKNPSKSFFINSLKGETVLKDVDVQYKASNINPLAFYYDDEHISSSKAYELGLIYPQGIESSFSSYLLNGENIKLIVDMCSAPGGKSINFINKYKNAYLISNDVDYKRQLLTANNFERLGIDSATICSMDTNVLSNKCKHSIDLVILDAPCSGEGMARKTDEIFGAYSDNEINKLSKLQSKLLDEAYEMLNGDSYLIYSTCTYSFEEDEDQVKSFLERHKDMSLININCDGNHSKLEGTIKLSFINNTEGQFIAIFKKEGKKDVINLPLKKEIRNEIVESFIKNNLNINDYYLYRIDDKFYLSFNKIIDLKTNIIREGIYLGDLIKNRFEPNHFMYRANSLKGLYKNEYKLNDEEYELFVKGLELKVNDLNKGYYHLTYNGYSVGFGKFSNGVIKNKYPKGLRKK